MATGAVILPIGGAALPDGSSGNLAPGIVRIKGTEADPKKHFLVALFDPGTDEFLWWTFRMPPDYASGGVVKLLWMANSASGNSVVWAAQIGAITPADTDTPVEHAQAAVSTATTAGNATEARRLIESSITLANLDSVAANDLVNLGVSRDANNASDTLAVDAELIAVSFEYTTT